MRAALVTETYPPEVNGVARTLERLVEGTRARAHHVEVIRPRQRRGDRAPRDDERLVPGLPLPAYPGLHFGLPVERRLRAWWRAARPELVHVATEGPLGLAAVRAARRLRIPVVTSFHTNFDQYAGHYRLAPLRRPVWAYLRRFHNATGGTAVPTRAMRERLGAAGVRRAAVVGRGVDLDRFGPGARSEALRAAWGAGPDDLVVAYVGRVAWEKNVGLAARAFDAIRAVRSDARLVVVGDGPAAPALAARAPDALQCGMQRDDALARHFASADLLLAPSLTETFGNVVTEGMASGLAVVAFNYAAGREHIRSGDNGMLAPFGDEAAFIRAARELAADPRAVSRIGASAARTAAELGWDHVVDALESFWRGAARLEPEPGDRMGARRLPPPTMVETGKEVPHGG